MSLELPPGATPIDVRDFFECIGELYFQVHKLRQMAAAAAQPAAPANGRAALEGVETK